MRPNPFTDPGDDGPEPPRRRDSAGSPPSGGSENDQDGFPDFPVEQGLFLTVPAGSFDSDQLAQSGPAADMPPDPLLATIIDVTAGPDGHGVRLPRLDGGDDGFGLGGGPAEEFTRIVVHEA